MSAVHPPLSQRAVWTFLRRTRQRLTKLVQDIPAATPRVVPVLEAMVAAETAMLAEDPDLLLRKSGRGPASVDVVDDTSQLAKRIEDLETAVRLREEQIAIVAHDLRGPLSPMMLLVHRLKEEVSSGVPIDHLKSRVEAISHRLDAFVHQLNALLDGTRLQTSDLALDPEPIDLPALARTIVDEARAGMVKPPEVAVTGQPTLTGSWDRLRVEQILRNLVGNALRYGALQPVEVQIDGAPEGEVAIVTVRDHGIGIPAKDHGRIFEKHVRLHTGKGFGLGLWIVKQLVEAMGGSISVRSSPGEGSEFKVILPRDGDGPDDSGAA